MQMLRFKNSIGVDIYINPEFVMDATQNGPDKVAMSYSSHSNVIVKGTLSAVVARLTGTKKIASKKK